MALNAGHIQHFERGYLGISQSLTGTSYIYGLQDVSLDYTIDVQEVQAFQTQFSKLQIPTYTSWSGEGSGLWLNLSGETHSPFSANTYVKDGISAKAILQLAKQRLTTNKVRFMYPDGSYETGTIIITSVNITSSTGEALTFSFSYVGSGDLTYSAS